MLADRDDETTDLSVFTLSLSLSFFLSFSYPHALTRQVQFCKTHIETR